MCSNPTRPTRFLKIEIDDIIYYQSQYLDMESSIREIQEEKLLESIRTITSGNAMINGEFLNRKQKQKSQRLEESSCLGVYRNHNSDTYRMKLRLKLLAKQMK